MIPRTVLLYGSSMLVSLVATSLTQYPELRVVQAPPWENACRRLEEGEPDVLIFDLTEGCERHILPLLFEHPGLLMIGLDVEANQAVLVSGQETRSLSLGQIREMIDGERRRKEDAVKRGQGPTALTGCSARVLRDGTGTGGRGPTGVLREDTGRRGNNENAQFGIIQEE